MLGGIDFGPIDVDGQGTAPTPDGAFETILHARQLLIPIKLGVGHEARVVVDEGEEENLAFLFGVGWIGQPRPVHRVALPEVAEVMTFEAAVGLGPLLGEELRRSGVAEG